MAERLEFEFVKESVGKTGYKLISEKYINNKTKLEMVCDKGHIFYMAWNQFNKGQRCPQCAHENRFGLTISKSEIIEFIKSKKYTIVDGLEEMHSVRDSKLTLMCPMGHIHMTNFDNFKRGKRCRKCYYLSMRTPIEHVLNLLVSRDCTPLVDESFPYKDCHDKIPYICNKHPDMKQETTYNLLQNGKGCKYCWYERLKYLKWWKGGISSLNAYVRNRISEWKTNSIKASEYKCVITKSHDFKVHHLYGFNLIMAETINELGIDVRDNVSKYSADELHQIVEKFNEMQNKYPLGVCLRKDIHILFHSIYGNKDNTPEQFKDFVSKINNNEIIIKDI